MSIIIICIMLVFSSSSNLDNPKVYYYDDQGNFCYVQYKLDDSLDIKSNIRGLIDYLIDNDLEENPLIPKGTELLNVHFFNGNVELLFSNDIMNYGGNAWEYAMINQLLATIFSVKEVDKVSFLIEGDRYLFNEGDEIIDYTRDMWNEREAMLWKELMEERITN